MRAVRRRGELTCSSLSCCHSLACLPKSARLWGEGGGGSRQFLPSPGPEIGSRDRLPPAGGGYGTAGARSPTGDCLTRPWAPPRSAPSGSSLPAMLTSMFLDLWAFARAHPGSAGSPLQLSELRLVVGGQGGEGAPSMHRGAHGAEPRFAHGPWAS